MGRRKPAEPGQQPRTTPKVGDDYALPGHCMVAFPDGAVVTASRTIKLVMAGTYRIIPNEAGQPETTVQVGKGDGEA